MVVLISWCRSRRLLERLLGHFVVHFAIISRGRRHLDDNGGERATGTAIGGNRDALHAALRPG